MNYYDYETKLGKITFIEEEGMIIKLLFNEYTDIKIVRKETKTIKRAYIELVEYLNGKRKNFTIPLNPKGTPFQKKVWKELLKIPYGEVISYQELAKRVGNIKAQRAVGGANNKNPIPIFIPCHRVINKNNKLGGYALGLDIKKYLLELEELKTD